MKHSRHRRRPRKENNYHQEAAPPPKGGRPVGEHAPLATAAALAAHLGIENWDFLLVGDGSGSNWGRPCGWASVSVERSSGECRVWWGALSHGTVNVAEILAYLQPLGWLASREEDRRRKRGARMAAYRVHIVTDSQYCEKTGNSEDRMVSKNGALWGVFDTFVRQGILLHWHWLGRGESELNSYVDKLSKLARVQLGGKNLLDLTGPMPDDA